MKFKMLLLILSIASTAICQEAYKVKSRIIRAMVGIDDKVTIDSNMNIPVTVVIIKKDLVSGKEVAMSNSAFKLNLNLVHFAKDENFESFKLDGEIIRFKSNEQDYEFILHRKNAKNNSKTSIDKILKEAYSEYKFRKDLEIAKTINNANVAKLKVEEQKETQVPSKL